MPHQLPTDSPRTAPLAPTPPGEPKRAIDLSTAKVGAAAAASVTTSLAASFFGTAGTLIGAALGAMVSTVAGAFYENSMHRAVDRVRATQAIAVQRLDGASPADPAAVPTASPTDAPPAVPTAVQPAVTDLTQVLPAVTDDTQALPATGVTPTGATPTGPASPTDAQPWWRGRVAAVAAACALAFVIAIGTITLAEGLLHKTVSGKSGTTVGRVFGDDGSSSSPTPTTSPTASAAPTATTPAAASPTRQVVAPTTAPTTAGPTTAPTSNGTTSSTTADTSAAVEGVSATTAP